MASVSASLISRPSPTLLFQGRSRLRPSPRARPTPAQAFILFDLVASSAAAAAVTAVSWATSEDRDAELARLQTAAGVVPLAAAVAADTVVHATPLLGSLINLAVEPLGAAAGVAYLMSIVLSSPAVDPKTLAPRGTVLAAEKAGDARGSLRVPFTRVIPTALAVVDTSNAGSSGAGWQAGAGELPRLPLNSVLVVVGVGAVILETLAHLPLLSAGLPRVLQTAAWVAAAGAVLDKRDD
ncbi:hypothetical protein ACKKBG_A00495 [Auxenochlorella protothecoides x Auxenochlorella symbiontica]